MSIRLPPNAPGDPRLSLDPEERARAQSAGYPIVAHQFARRDRAGLALGASVALLLGAGTLFALSTNRTRPALQPIAPPAPGLLAPAYVPTPVQVPMNPITPAPVAAPPMTLAPAVLPAPMSPVTLAASPALDRARAPALIVDNSLAANTTPAAPPAAAVPSAKPPAGTLTPEEQFAQRITGAAEGTSATRLLSPSTTIAQGTLMSAVLETAIVSDLPGYVRAVISRDVKSYDGTTILVPRGSHVVGEYKSGLSVGQTRAFVLWSRLLRPDGVSIALGSPATDSTGRNGLSGKVDSHFGKRFGAAILLSAIGALGQAIGGGNSAVVIAGPQQAVSTTAQQSIAIPPTVHVLSGQPIRIFVARDLDFSTVSPSK